MPRLRSHTEPLQETLFAEMKGRIKEDDSTVPSPDGPHAYFVRYREGGQHPIACRAPRDGGPEQVLLDGDALAAGKAFFQFGGMQHSPDHRLIAWSADDNGSEYDTLRVRDAATGQDLPDTIADIEGSVVWTVDSSAFYYVRLDTNPPCASIATASVRRRRMMQSSGKRTTASSSRSGARNPAASPTSRCTITRPRDRLIDLAVPAQRRGWSRRASTVLYDVEHHPTGRASAGRAHQCGGRGGLQADSRRSTGRSGRAGAISSAAWHLSLLSVAVPTGWSARARGRRRASWCSGSTGRGA
jgi:oligopeptidase B